MDFDSRDCYRFRPEGDAIRGISVETSRAFDADLYAPSIEPRSEMGHWVLSGIMVTRDSVAGRPRYRTGRGLFSAILELRAVRSLPQGGNVELPIYGYPFIRLFFETEIPIFVLPSLHIIIQIPFKSPEIIQP